MTDNFSLPHILSRTLCVAAVAAGLMAVPLPQQTRYAAAQTPAPATTTDAKTKKPPSAAVTAMRARQKQCGAEWKADKAAGKIEKGMKWPQYWSACNKRLKSGG